MDYPQVLKYLYEQLPMFQRIGPSAFKKDLHNTLSLCAALGNPHKKFKTIHVGGTNGKGSSSHMLAACFQSAGYKTGLYTSPHLKEFTERVRINGLEIPKESVVQFVVDNKALIEEVQPSFFEMTVVLAFDYFAKHNVDIAIIEVGLGGRLDSTNVIDPIVSLITNISYDHQSLLGNTLPEIAYEKAGIIKPGKPIVISQTQPEVVQVFKDKALNEDALLYFADNEISVQKKALSQGKLIVNALKDSEPLYKDLELGLTADYQMLNIPGVLKIVELVNQMGYTLNEESIREGLAKVVSLTGLKGRWQKLSDNPKIICDTGHNEDGIKEVLVQIAQTDYKNLFLVFGTVKDKDPAKILTLLPKNAYYFFCEANIPRALSAEDLFIAATTAGLKGEIIKDINTAVAKAKLHAKEEDLIFVGGSNFVVAEIDNL